MASEFNTLMYGELDNVRSIVESRELDNSELRAVLMNLIDKIQRAERSALTAFRAAETASCLANGIKPI